MERKPLELHGVVVPPDERTPVVEQLLEVIRRLTAEIERLKGLPEKPQRVPAAPSGLNQPEPPSRAKGKGRGRGRKRRPGAKRSKTGQLPVTDTRELTIGGLPEGTKVVGHRDYFVQNLTFEAHHIRFRRTRYLLPDGTYLTAPLPPHVRGHFGGDLRAYTLYQHHQNHVTQPLILEELRELGIDISAGMLDRLLTEEHGPFHAEKDSLLPAAREVSDYLQTDDTPSRHQGRAGHTNHIGNAFFASFTTTETKSRVNFLQILCAPYHEYILNSDAFFYMEWHGLPACLLNRLKAELAPGMSQAWEEDGDWQTQLDNWKVLAAEHRRIITEGSLFACLLAHDLYMDLRLVSDDAAQFKVLGIDHGVCWLHAERHVARLIPLTPAQQQAHDRIRDAIWSYYQRLKAYRESPTTLRRTLLDRDFDRLFLGATGWPELDTVLRRIHERKDNLLMVLEHPEIPLHNNLSESDIREWAKKRKISAGTRSDLGRRCRDTFVSLKKTCRKLGIAFWKYLRDRISGTGEIPPLAEVIRRAAGAAAPS